MLVLFLLFLAVPEFSAKDPRCPGNFTYFKRTPTAKNNFTKGWCLGIFNETDLGNRDRARSVCIYYNASLSIPENSHELEVISKTASLRNISVPIALDGQLSPRCKFAIYKGQVKGAKRFNQTSEEGICNIKYELFIYDDINTDTSFIRTKLGVSAGSNVRSVQADDDIEYRSTADCTVLEKGSYHYSNGTLKDGHTNLMDCMGQLAGSKRLPEKNVTAVLCGRLPF